MGDVPSIHKRSMVVYNGNLHEKGSRHPNAHLHSVQKRDSIIEITINRIVVIL